MGNGNSRERRHQASSGPDPDLSQRSASLAAQGAAAEYPATPPANARSRRANNDSILFGLVGATQQDGPEARRETKHEREERRLEREKLARLKERERSMRDEHVDGGYLVTQGVYTGIEDFNKEIVRQLMIMRCIAPFWRGLEDFNSEWTEYQLVAAAKGLPIPPADQIPPELEAPPAAESKHPSTSNAIPLTVPIKDRTDSTASDASANIARILSSSENTHTSSPFRPRSKTIASLTSKSPSQADMVPREIQLPVDPYVNGLRLEAFLYKDAIECPICFIYYPPYLNQTRCCDQPICSECFVQIKRPDPHPPEHPDPTNPAPPEENPETLVSEPANCPYCQQAEFGVTYDPPPFRRGLAYANMNNSQLANVMAASESSPTNGPSSSLRPAGSRRRAASVSANASNVVTTDKIRPDWATKLANARNHAARRSAAATALHTAAYLMGNGGGLEGRGFGFSGRSRFGRIRDSPGESSTPPASGPDAAARIAALNNMAAAHDQRQRDGQTEGRRRSRMDDLEDMMMMEAIRLSIVAEEERKRKEEKEAKKEVKKKEKEQKKADKAADKAAAKNGIYGGSGSRTASALSLVLPGRRRGNSGSSAMAREANNYSIEHTYPTSDSTDKGKGVDRTGSASSSSHPYPSGVDGPSSQSYGHHLSVDDSAPSISTPPAATGAIPDRPSHLRQISSASSPSSSYIESAPGSIRRGHTAFQASTSTIDSPSGSNTDLAHSHNRERSRDRDNDPGSAGDEPMFNFRSLAEIVGREDEKDGYEANQVEYANENLRPDSKAGPSHVSIESVGYVPESNESNPFDDSEELMDQSVATLKAEDYEGADERQASSGNGYLSTPMDTPEVMVTPVTPAPVGEGEDRQLGH